LELDKGRKRKKKETGLNRTLAKDRQNKTKKRANLKRNDAIEKIVVEREGRGKGRDQKASGKHLGGGKIEREEEPGERKDVWRRNDKKNRRRWGHWAFFAREGINGLGGNPRSFRRCRHGKKAKDG